MGGFAEFGDGHAEFRGHGVGNSREEFARRHDYDEPNGQNRQEKYSANPSWLRGTGIRHDQAWPSRERAERNRGIDR